MFKDLGTYFIFEILFLEIFDSDLVPLRYIDD